MGNFNGSVFQVAARANNVTYDRADCCGTSGVMNDATGTAKLFVLRAVLMGLFVLFVTSV